MMGSLRWLVWRLTGIGSFGLIVTGYCVHPAGHPGECEPELASLW